MSTSHIDRRLCVIVCGAGPAFDVGNLLSLADQAGWRPHVVATPSALKFLDVEALGRQTGSPVRSDYGQRPEGPRSSDADGLVIAPATYNTINKLAVGINDTYALNVAAEAMGRGIPTAILPFVNAALASRLPFVKAVESLRQEGAAVLIGEGEWKPHPPGSGGAMIASFPWAKALEAVGQG